MRWIDRTRVRLVTFLLVAMAINLFGALYGDDVVFRWLDAAGVPFFLTMAWVVALDENRE